MKNFFRMTVLLVAAGSTVIACTATAASSDEEKAKALARKDYQLAQARIEAHDRAAMDECAKRGGPAANACMIQAHGKRLRDEEEAKATVARAGATPPLPTADAQKAARAAVAKAKADKKAADQKIAAERHAARAECAKLKGVDRKACIREVDVRRNDAKDWAEARYKRSILEAKSMTAP
jgi:colicin import membrane protein